MIIKLDDSCIDNADRILKIICSWLYFALCFVSIKGVAIYITVVLGINILIPLIRNGPTEMDEFYYMSIPQFDYFKMLSDVAAGVLATLSWAYVYNEYNDAHKMNNVIKILCFIGGLIHTMIIMRAFVLECNNRQSNNAIKPPIAEELV